jgi:Calx-beta domain
MTPLHTPRLARTALVAVLLVLLGGLSLAVPAAAGAAATGATVTGITSGGSLVYAKANNIWLSNPDGSSARQLTTDGTASRPYRDPSQSDDGNVIVAVQDRPDANGFATSWLYEMNRSGTLLRPAFAPTQYTTRLGGACTIPVLTSPWGVLATVSPDGTKIAVSPEASFYDFDCGGTFESYIYVISLAGATVNGTISNGSAGENLEQPEWIGSSRLIMYAEFANAVDYYDLGQATAHQWIASSGVENAFQYPAVAGGKLVTTGYGNNLGRALQLWTTNGAAPTAPTLRCEIYTGTSDTGAYYAHVAPDGAAVVWMEEDPGVGASTDGIWISPVGSIAGGDCSSLQRQLLVSGGSDPFWGPAGLSAPPATTLSVNDVSVTEGSSGTKAATFTLTRSGSTTGSSTVTYATANGTATAGSDYTAVPATAVTFAAGETTKSVSVSVLGDTTVEPNETFTLGLSAPTGATIADAIGVATITNDDSAPTATGPAYLTVGDVRLPEGSSGSTPATFTVTRYGGTSAAVSVTYGTASGSAAAGSDFTAVAPTRLTFAAGETSKTVAVPVLGDTVPEADEAFSLVLSAPSGATLSDSSGAGTIVTDDAPAYLAVNDITTAEGAGGSHAATFTVTRTGNTAVAASVKYATSSATATAASDYTTLPLTTLSFAAGQTSRTVSVSVLGDTVVEGAETFRLLLSSPSGATLADSSGTATIANDDGTAVAGPATWVSVSDGQRVEGGSGSSLATFTVTRYGRTTGTSSVRYATANGTAVAGSDYTAVPATTVTFAAGETSKTVTVPVLGDTSPEPTETFTVGLSSPVGAVVADSSAVGTIVNDDAPAYLRVDDLSLTEGNAGTTSAGFRITRTGNTAVASTVTCRTVNGTAVAGSDYTALPVTSVTFAAGETAKTVLASVTGDTTVEASETFSLLLSGQVGAFVTDGTAVATVVNDD